MRKRGKIERDIREKEVKMGSTADPTLITHFSHPHPLKLTLKLKDDDKKKTPSPSPSPSPSCGGCNLPASAIGLFYSCTKCNYFLHFECSKTMPDNASTSRSIPQPQPQNPNLPNYNFMMPNNINQVNPFMPNNFGGPLMPWQNSNLVALQMLQNQANFQNQLNQQYLQGLLAGGGISGGIGGLGGGLGGGGAGGLQAILQGLMGSGGLDISSLLGGFLGGGFGF